MALELEAPSVIEQPEVRLFAEPPEAVEAAELLDAVEMEIVAEHAVESELVTEGGQEEATADQASEQEVVSDDQEATQGEAPLPPAPKPQPSAYEIRRRQYLREKDVLQEQISALMIEQAKLKEQAKRCKKEAEVYIDQLNNLIEAWEHLAQLENEPPTAAGPMATTSPSVDASGFGTVPPDRPANTTDVQAEPAGTPDSPASTYASQAAEQAAEQAHYQRALEAASVDQLGLPAKLVERLQEAGATTVWRLEQLRAEIAQGREKWPKGIGEAKVTQIEDAIISWMGRNSETWQKSHRDAIAEEVKEEAGEEAATQEDRPPAAAGPAVSTDIDDL